MITRREWMRRVAATPVLAAVSAPVAARFGPTASPVYRGVTLGVQSYSFRDRSLDEAIAAMRQVGLASCELWQAHVEPRGVSRDELRRWRETTPLDVFASVKDRFARAGIRIQAYNISFRDDFSDAEIERGFEMTRALGAGTITASANTRVVARVAKAAARHGIAVGMHNHSRVHPDEFATPADFERAIGEGRFIAVNLDIGHFTAANFDAVEFLGAYHDRIVSLHIKDRKRQDGPNVAFGQGDTPIGPVLRLLRDRAWAIPANIEYEYQGGDTIEEVRRCLDYCRRELDR